MIEQFDLSPTKTATPSTGLALFDSLKVLSGFEDTTKILKPIRKIIYRNNRWFIKRNYDLNHRLLTQMGNPNYKSWKVILASK